MPDERRRFNLVSVGEREVERERREGGREREREEGKGRKRAFESSWHVSVYNIWGKYAFMDTQSLSVGHFASKTCYCNLDGISNIDDGIGTCS